MKKILITGCAGFIGMHLSKSLLEKGFKVLQNSNKRVVVDELKHYLKAFNDDEVTDKQLEEFISSLPTNGKNLDVDSLVTLIKYIECF